MIHIVYDTRLHRCVCVCGCVPQEAVGRALETETARLGQPECYFSELAQLLERKRDEMALVLREVGLDPIIPEGGYFMMADTTSLGEDMMYTCAPSSTVYMYIDSIRPAICVIYTCMA